MACAACQGISCNAHNCCSMGCPIALPSQIVHMSLYYMLCDTPQHIPVNSMLCDALQRPHIMAFNTPQHMCLMQLAACLRWSRLLEVLIPDISSDCLDILGQPIVDVSTTLFCLEAMLQQPRG